MGHAVNVTMIPKSKFLENNRVKRLIFSTPFVILIFCMVVAMLIVMFLSQRRDAFSTLRMTMVAESRSHSSEMETRFNRIENAVTGIAKRGVPGDVVGIDEWQEDVLFLVDALAGLTLVAWIDGDFLVRDVAPITQNLWQIGDQPNASGNDPGWLTIWSPMYGEESFEGFIVGLVSVDDFVSPIASGTEGRLSIYVTDGVEITYQSSDWTTSARELSASRFTALGESAVWNFTVAPSKQLVLSVVSESRYAFVASFGIAIMSLIASLFAGSRRRKSISLEKTLRELAGLGETLELQVRDRTADLASANRLLESEIVERKQAEVGLRTSEKELALRNKISEVFLMNGDKQAYVSILELLLEALDSSFGLLGYLDEDGLLVYSTLKCNTGGLTSETHGCIPRDEWSGIWGIALTEGKALSANELQLADSRFPMVRAVAATMSLDAQVIGVLVAANRSSDYHSQDTLFLDSITAVIAPILHTRLRGESATKALEISTEEMRLLARRLADVREEERASLARELHDTIGQAITAVRLDLDHFVRSPLKKGKTPQVEELAGLYTLLDQTVDDIRQVCTDLRPPVLDDFGLQGAIEWHADRVSQRTGMHFNLRMPTTSLDLDEQRRTSLFRVFQEILTNVIRHAQASRCEINLDFDDNLVCLTVTDDGRGMNIEKLDVRKSIGIAGMRERLIPVRGELTFKSSPGAGTTVRVAMPVS